MVFLLCLCLLWVPVRASTEEKLVALTFDDGPSGRFTRRLLEGLAQRDAKATFFLCGYRLEQYPRLAEAIVAEGHEVGVHG
jgi:peptidoglycan/xylan/chitin deacetylase (PgdA/CDA1 family)